MRSSFLSQCAVASQASASYTSAGFANGVFSFERELSLISNRSGKASHASATASPTLSMRTGVSSGRPAFPALDIGLPPLLFRLAAADDQVVQLPGLVVPPPALGVQLVVAASEPAVLLAQRFQFGLQPIPFGCQRLDRRRVCVGLLPGRRLSSSTAGSAPCAAVAASRACLARAMRSCHSAVSFRIPSSAARRASDRSSSSWREAACGRKRPVGLQLHPQRGQELERSDQKLRSAKRAWNVSGLIPR